MAAQEANRQRDEALADRIGVSVVRELAEMLTTRKVPGGGE